MMDRHKNEYFTEFWNKLLFTFFLVYICMKLCKGESVITCQGESARLQCSEPGHVLVVEQATYGRTNKYECGGKTPLLGSCALPSSLTTVNSKCFGRTQCSVPVDSSTFADPCPGYTKYLNTTYQCVDKTSIVDICDHQVISLHSGYLISPDYPARYKPSLNCRTTFIYSHHEGVHVELLDMELEARVSKGCYDKLILREEEVAWMKYDLCGNFMTMDKTELINFAKLNMQLKTDTLNEYRGFLIKFKSVPPVDRSKEIWQIQQDREKKQKFLEQEKAEAEARNKMGPPPKALPKFPSPAEKYKKKHQPEDRLDKIKSLAEVDAPSNDRIIDGADVYSVKKESKSIAETNSKYNSDLSPELSKLELLKRLEPRLQEVAKNLTNEQLFTLNKLQNTPSFKMMLDFLINSNQSISDMVQGLLKEHPHNHDHNRVRPKHVGMKAAIKSMLNNEGGCTLAEAEPLLPLHGEVQGLKEGKIFHVGCDTGYVISDKDEATFVCSQSRWAGATTAYCVPYQCPSLQPPPHGYVYASDLRHGSQAEYYCDTGFLPVGDTTRTCLVSSEWSGMEPACKALKNKSGRLGSLIPIEIPIALMLTIIFFMLKQRFRYISSKIRHKLM